MSELISTESDILRRDRLLAIGDNPALAEYLRNRYPNCHVKRATTMLEGIGNLTQYNTRAVIAEVSQKSNQLLEAISGLREAAGDHTKVLLCCNPEDEPKARHGLKAGADDYLILPLEGTELDRALGFTGSIPRFEQTQPPSPSPEELKALGNLLANLGEDPFSVLGKLADLLRLAMGSESITVIVEGSAATSGGTVVEPVLVEPISQDGRVIGQITVGNRSLPYGATDLARLQHYADLTAHLLSAATRQRKWRKEAMTDEVSGLFNRRYAFEFLERAISKAKEERSRVTVLLFDIDNFKTYNDTYGHPAGDAIIRHVGQLFNTHSREHDVVTRYGGDEFCVIFWDAEQPRVAGSDHPSDALTVLARFQEALKNHHCDSLDNAVKGQLTISGGLASYPWDASTPSELIAKADQALLMAKQAGKNRVFVFGNTPSAN